MIVIQSKDGEFMMLSNTVCFTGHRNQKLPWGLILKKTIEYAKRQDKEIIVISPRTNKIITKADIDIMVNDYFKAQPHASKLYKNSYRMFLNFIYKLNFSEN